MDSILFGAGFKQVIGGMVLIAASVVFTFAFIGYMQGVTSPDKVALVGAGFGVVSITGIALMLRAELRHIRRDKRRAAASGDAA